VKHFALNEQETNRWSRLATWVDEQTLREIYLKPFEHSVKDGSAGAVMSAFNYIGGIWAGGNGSLLNTVLRDEWGFQGMVITDYFAGNYYMDANQAIANGGDLMLSTLGNYGAQVVGDNATVVSQLRQASKNILFTVAHSNAMFDHAKRTEMLTEVGGTVSELSGFPRLAYDMGMQAWQLAAYLINGAIVVLLLTLAAFKVRKYVKLFGRQKEAATE
jgi:beta-glucosidase